MMTNWSSLHYRGILFLNKIRQKKILPKEGKQMDTEEQEMPRPNSLSMFHYDEQTRCLTLKRRFFEPQSKEKEITSTSGIILTLKEPLPLLDKIEMTSDKIAAQLLEEEERRRQSKER